jgi:hypothetical protein
MGGEVYGGGNRKRDVNGKERKRRSHGERVGA